MGILSSTSFAFPIVLLSAIVSSFLLRITKLRRSVVLLGFRTIASKVTFLAAIEACRVSILATSTIDALHQRIDHGLPVRRVICRSGIGRLSIR